MRFRTELQITPFPYSIDYHSSIFGMGSCFVDNMKEKLDEYKFQNLINPFGVIFNPYSLLNLIERVINKDFFTEKDIFYHENEWKSFEVHSFFNRSSKEVFLKEINQTIEMTHGFLQKADWILITYGTSWVYKRIETGEVVANCHKVPQKKFNKVLLSPTEIKQNIDKTISLLSKFNPRAKFLFSISPVRHLKDGFVENNQSKSLLHAALHPLIDQVRSFYFPSYEIMMDDLRDYRFYKKDFVHPNELAIEYIWEKFKTALISPAIFDDMKKIEKLNKFLSHRPITDKTIEMPAKLILFKEELQAKYPHLYFSKP